MNAIGRPVSREVVLANRANQDLLMSSSVKQHTLIHEGALRRSEGPQ
jgi:hypothetical protein